MLTHTYIHLCHSFTAAFATAEATTKSIAFTLLLDIVTWITVLVIEKGSLIPRLYQLARVTNPFLLLKHSYCLL